jgi:rare lipoprotein A
MRYAIRGFGALATLAVLASCGSIDGKSDSGGLKTASSSESASPAPTGISDEPVKLGTPYTVGGTTYTPLDTAQYDEVGYASYYGAELAGRSTANGEIFNPAGASAAHKTLPMPSYVEVTALETGRTILVRVNDRGPFANDRLIDLSEGAARQLGIGPQGVAGVRVRRVNPPEQEKSVLRQGMTAAERIETPGPLLKVLRDKLAKQPKPSLASQNPAPAKGKPARIEPSVATEDGRFIRESGSASRPKAPSSRPAPAATGDYVAQVAAFSTRARADALARRLGASVTASPDGRVFRVRFGPYATESEAAAAARQKGYPQARVYRD